ncbi:hypothetical protein O8W32_08585 [Methanomassiliicoccales archaeon LGM-DZ1]|nr:hypothetical protein O8W32_08585 [Methanomassiliicoccales archaeon LGM-DZ1]
MESVEQNNSKKKLIVPLIALMLCAVAVIGIGYGLNSTSTNNDNAVTGNALVVDLRNTDGSASLVGNGFANGAEIGFVTTQTNGNTKVSIDGASDVAVGDVTYKAVKIGEGKLKVSASNSGSSTSSTVNVSVTLNKTAGTVPTDMKFILAAGSTNYVISLGNALVAGTITLTGESSDAFLNGEESFVLYASLVNADYTNAIADYSGFTYSILFSVSN